MFETPLEDVRIESDGTNIYNSITINFGEDGRTYSVKDDASITKYGEREFVIDVPFLTKHQNKWAEWAAGQALQSFKDLQYLISLTLSPRFDIDIGDYVYLQVPRDDIRRIGQVVRVVYSTDRAITEVDIRTISYSSGN